TIYYGIEKDGETLIDIEEYGGPIDLSQYEAGEYTVEARTRGTGSLRLASGICRDISIRSLYQRRHFLIMSGGSTALLYK
ncbi:MAG: hypothetical protein II133_05155, partial [Lachnospiraceae bacterium]|nr:hypothetical protein [Lachnospiraceae bacterium]